MSRDEYPLDLYPTYCGGPCTLLSRYHADRIYEGLGQFYIIHMILTTPIGFKIHQTKLLSLRTQEILHSKMYYSLVLSGPKQISQNQTMFVKSVSIIIQTIRLPKSGNGQKVRSSISYNSQLQAKI